MHAAIPTPRDHLALAALNGRLYAIGGRLEGSSLQNVNANEAYDPATDRWEPRTPLPTARSGIAAAVVDGRIFVFGGEQRGFGTFGESEAYDGNAWSDHARMPTPRHGLGAAAVGGRIFVISGGPRPGGSLSGANEIFSP